VAPVAQILKDSMNRNCISGEKREGKEEGIQPHDPSWE